MSNTVSLVKTPDSALDGATLETLDALSAEYQHWSNAIAYGESMKKILGEQVQTLLDACDADTIQSTAYRVTLVRNAGAFRLDEKKLLANGVDPETIAASKTQGKPSQHVKVTKGKTDYTPEVIRKAPTTSAPSTEEGE